MHSTLRGCSPKEREYNCFPCSTSGNGIPTFYFWPATRVADVSAAKASSDSKAGHLPPTPLPLPLGSAAVPVKADPELSEAVLGFSRGVLGTAVLSLSDVRDKLLLRQVCW